MAVSLSDKKVLAEVAHSLVLTFYNWLPVLMDRLEAPYAARFSSARGAAPVCDCEHDVTEATAEKKPTVFVRLSSMVQFSADTKFSMDTR
jgi:hypothetical protein